MSQTLVYIISWWKIPR